MISVMLIDDEPDLLDLFSAMLRRTGFQVITALGSMKALEVLKETVPDLILLDVAMPDIDGLQLLRMLRADARLSSTKIVLLTAVPVMVKQNDAELADRVVAKPVTTRELEALVNSVVTA